MIMKSRSNPLDGAPSALIITSANRPDGRVSPKSICVFEDFSP